MAVPVMARAGSAAADDRPLPDVICADTVWCPPPPLLGTLDRGLTTATPDQVKSFADGAGLDTNTPGRHQFVVTARDHAGNAHTLTVTYHVAARPICAGRPATIVGTAGNDVITGTLGDDVIVTGAGRDWIRGRGGDDVICSGADRDFVSAGGGDDTVDTGAGRDVGSGGIGDDTITGRANADILTGGLGADTLNGNTGDDNLIGHDGDDDLNGGPDTDTCRGGGATDQQTACEFTLGVP
jgi:Ca2+-binding RTX toxin-like protein